MASRQNAVNDAKRNLDNAQAAAAQHTKDLQLDIDQIAQRLGEHTAQLNTHQAKYNFDSQQADSARAAELDTLHRIDAERATLAAIEDRQRQKNCMTSGQSTSGNGTSNNTGTASTQTKAANPLTPSDPNLLPGPADVSAPDSPEGQEGAGYLWDSALRAGLSVRNYGFLIVDNNMAYLLAQPTGLAEVVAGRDPRWRAAATFGQFRVFLRAAP